jgi:hypothetical protein
MNHIQQLQSHHIKGIFSVLVALTCLFIVISLGSTWTTTKTTTIVSSGSWSTVVEQDIHLSYVHSCVTTTIPSNNFNYFVCQSFDFSSYVTKADTSGSTGYSPTSVCNGYNHVCSCFSAARATHAFLILSLLALAASLLLHFCFKSQIWFLKFLGNKLLVGGLITSLVFIVISIAAWAGGKCFSGFADSSRSQVGLEINTSTHLSS